MSKNDVGPPSVVKIVVLTENQHILCRKISSLCDKFVLDGRLSLLEISGVLHHIAVACDVSTAARVVADAANQPKIEVPLSGIDKTIKVPGVENN